MSSQEVSSQRIRVMTVVGTRPELIRLALVIPRFDKTFDHFFLHTGQNSDPTLSDVFFSDLGLREPDLYLGIDTTSLGSQLAEVIRGTELAIRQFRPDALVVLGDTNSSMSAIIARRMGVAVYHLEAGNRSFDSNVPEEINRRLVDHIADFNLVYSEHARKNLLSEGLHPRQITKTGSPLTELRNFFGPLPNNDVLSRLDLQKGGFILASLHRQENIDVPERATEALQTLFSVANHFEVKLVVSTHPRLRDKMSRLNVANDERVLFNVPFGYWEYMQLQMNSLCVLSDSGSISEESAIFGFNAITMRDSMERPEALESATLPLVGLDAGEAIRGVEQVTSRVHVPCPDDYEISNFSERVANFILSTVRRRNFWLGIREIN